MFDFFRKKYFLADYLENFVDIHNHILPGIDDGAKHVDHSIQMIRAFGEIGVEKFICTPHIMPNFYPNTPHTIQEASEVVKSALSEHQMLHVELDKAAEHLIDPDFISTLENEEIMPLAKNYILVETSFLQPPINYHEILIRLTSHRLAPILAHPERYGYVKEHPGFLKELKDQGILFQLNILSLSGYYGSDVLKRAYQLIEEDMIDFIASDAHRLDHIQRIREIKLANSELQKVIPLINNTIATFY